MRLLRVVPLALLVAGCGGGGSSSDPSAVTTLRAAMHALTRLHSLHITDTEVSPQGVQHLEADWAGDGKVQVSIRQGTERARVVELGPQAFVSGNAAFWMTESHLPPRVAAYLDGRWVATAPGALSRSLGAVTPGRIARCLTTAMGTVHAAGDARLGGAPVKVVVTDGDAPGTMPARIYVSAGNRALPLRMVQTGPERPGMVNAVCSDPRDHSTHAELRLSGFDRRIHITAPRGALTAEQIQAALATAPVVPQA